MQYERDAHCNIGISLKMRVAHASMRLADANIVMWPHAEKTIVKTRHEAHFEYCHRSRAMEVEDSFLVYHVCLSRCPCYEAELTRILYRGLGALDLDQPTTRCSLNGLEACINKNMRMRFKRSILVKASLHQSAYSTFPRTIKANTFVTLAGPRNHALPACSHMAT